MLNVVVLWLESEIDPIPSLHALPPFALLDYVVLLENVALLLVCDAEVLLMINVVRGGCACSIAPCILVLLHLNLFILLILSSYFWFTYLLPPLYLWICLRRLARRL
jgi:hypothetical protein